MLKFKACSRCHGDVRIDPDRHGAEVYCLQCGVRRWFSPEEFRSLATPAGVPGAAGPDRRAA